MSGIPAYDAGDPVRLIGTFVNSGGTMTTPGAVTLSIIPPAQWGAVVPGTTSVYYDMLPLPSGTPGVWQYSFVGSGPYAAFTDQFFVRQGVR
jgi:hypothetical protein